MKLWGGRFESGPSEVFERFSGSLHFDRRLLDADIRGSQAFARALEDIGILTADERGRIFDALVAIRQEPVPPDATDEDIHTFVIRRLKEVAGDVADRIHTGRSRNEQVSLDTRLWLRDECDRVDLLLRDWLKSLIDLADKYPDAIIPGYTHTRRAQPVLWVHYLLAYFDMFTRDRERFAEARRRIDVLPLGSGALAGSGFPFDRERIARDLEFARISTNSLDVSADRDFVLDFLYAASNTMLHLSRVCEDWILYSSEEFGWIELGDGVTSGSSLMPQKKNPDSLELIRGKCGSVIGALNALMITMKGLPLTYNRDMQEDKEPLFHAADQLAGSLEMARATAETVILHPKIPLASAEASWAVATDLAEALARSGVPFHHAHQLVGKLVLAGKRPSEWNSESLHRFSSEFTPEIARYLDPREGMKTRELPGGTGPSAVAQAMKTARATL